MKMEWWPRLVLWVHERTLARDVDERDAILGDLLEEYTAIANRSPRAASRWLWSQTCRSVVPNLRRRFAADRAMPGTPTQEGTRMLNGLVADMKFALRLMKRQPLAAAVAFVSLSAGLGLNILLLTLADAALFRPLPLREPDQLALVLLQRESGLNHNLSYSDYEALRDGARTIDSVVAYANAQGTTSGRGDAERLMGEAVSGNFFQALGVPLRTGRPLSESDDRADAPPVAVISERLWQTKFGGAPLTGQTIGLNNQWFSIVGVASARFQGMQIGTNAAFWVPLTHSRHVVGGDYVRQPGVSWLTVVARPRADASLDVVRQELGTILLGARKATRRPFEPVVLQPGGRGDSMLSGRLESPLLLLMIAGGLVLLVACFNVANLQLARAEARRLELAVRAALGARRVQLVRLMLVDSLMLAVAAGIAGVGLAIAFKDRAASLVALWGEPVSLVVPVDGRVIAAAGGLSILAGLVIAFLSTIHVVRRNPARELEDGRAVTTTRRSLQRLLVAAQIALSMALLTGAGQLVRTLDRLRQTDLGFDSHAIALVQVSPESGKATPIDYFNETVRTLATVPGVERAAVAHVMPLDFGGSRMSIDIPNYKPGPDEDMELNIVRVTLGYFSTLGIPILQGRAFDERDDLKGQPRRIIVNETMARRFWRDGQAVGSYVRFDGRAPFDVEVVGVVPDVHYRMVREEPAPSFYAPMSQWPARQGVIHVRVAGDPAAAVETLRRAVLAVNPAVPVTRAYTLRDQVERNISDERMAMAIGTTLATIALLLATVGLYATMAFLVGRRTREIGVRMALGARSAEVRRLVIREAVVLALVGVGAGVAMSVWVGHAIRNQLYGVNAIDPVSLAAAGAILAGAAIAAGWIPARRASRIDPVIALRES
jgi:predicted permease